MLSNVINLPTDLSEFKSFAIKDNDGEHLVLYKGEIENKQCYIRVHSECLTGDVFKSQRCDCGNQLNTALEIIAKNDGILVYLRQEGRGIGLFNKIECYKLQEQGMDTVEANLKMGLAVDTRKYDIIVEIINKLKPSALKLITNNPEKYNALKNLLLIPIELVTVEAQVNKYNAKYLATKIEKMNHLIEYKDVS